MITKEQQKQAEDDLQAIALKADVSRRRIYELVNKAYIDEENLQKRAMALRELDQRNRQMQLLDIQTRNEYLHNLFLEQRLLAKKRRKEFFTKLKNPVKWIQFKKSAK